jgi:acyl carrier protein
MPRCKSRSLTPAAPVSERLDEAFRKALDLPDDTDVRSLEYGKHSHWDSVGHMALVAEIEDTYDVMFDTDDVLDMSSYDKAVEIVTKLGAAV